MDQYRERSINAMDPIDYLVDRFGPSERSSKQPIEHTFTERMRPSYANSHGNVFGGDILASMDEKASIVAERYAEQEVVTASVGNMSFEEPVYTDDVLVLDVSVDYVGATSMTLSVDVYAEDIQTEERRETGNAYFTFVALDETGSPDTVPELDLETAEQHTRYDEAEAFRDQVLDDLA